jgi:hypothetical protein
MKAIPKAFKPVERNGYVYCAHLHCFAITIGKEGDLCDDCRETGSEPTDSSCEGCDNDNQPDQP